jgi:hypothetical protein
MLFVMWFFIWVVVSALGKECQLGGSLNPIHVVISRW